MNIKELGDKIANALIWYHVFPFDWTWGSENYDGDFISDEVLASLSERDRDYFDAVRAAQAKSDEYMQKAFHAFCDEDFKEARACIEKASDEEKQFGDNPTFKLLLEDFAKLEKMIEEMEVA